jgi:hypothetical protein
MASVAADVGVAPDDTLAPQVRQKRLVVGISDEHSGHLGISN